MCANDNSMVAHDNSTYDHDSQACAADSPEHTHANNVAPGSESFNESGNLGVSGHHLNISSGKTDSSERPGCVLRSGSAGVEGRRLNSPDTCFLLDLVGAVLEESRQQQAACAPDLEQWKLARHAQIKFEHKSRDDWRLEVRQRAERKRALARESQRQKSLKIQRRRTRENKQRLDHMKKVKLQIEAERTRHSRRVAKREAELRAARRITNPRRTREHKGRKPRSRRRSTLEGRRGLDLGHSSFGALGLAPDSLAPANRRGFARPLKFLRENARREEKIEKDVGTRLRRELAKLKLIDYATAEDIRAALAGGFIVAHGE
eukprot:19502_1